jgi:hypothetical protein
MIFYFWCLAPLSAIFQQYISWRPVLVVEEAGVTGENYRPWASNWYKLYHLRLRVECTLSCNLQEHCWLNKISLVGIAFINVMKRGRILRECHYVNE